MRWKLKGQALLKVRRQKTSVAGRVYKVFSCASEERGRRGWLANKAKDRVTATKFMPNIVVDGLYILPEIKIKIAITMLCDYDSLILSHIKTEEGD
jgi:hypothetical protein